MHVQPMRFTMGRRIKEETSPPRIRFYAQKQNPIPVGVSLRLVVVVMIGKPRPVNA